MTRSANNRTGNRLVQDFLNELERRVTAIRKAIVNLYGGADQSPTLADYTYWDDIQNSLIGRRLSSVAGAVDYDWENNTIVFSANGDITDSDDRVAWNIQLPHGTKLPSFLKVHIHYEQSDAVVRTMTIRYRIQSNNNAKQTTWTTVSVDTDESVWTWTSGTLNNILPLVDVDLTNAGLSDIVQFQMTRTDSETGTLPVLFADAHVERSKLGTSNEFS